MAETVEIYALRDPETNEIRYIGKANNSQARLKSHLRDARTRRTPVYSWINSLLRRGLSPDMIVLETCGPDVWKEREIALIAQYRAASSRLLNVADGGDEPFCPIE